MNCSNSIFPGHWDDFLGEEKAQPYFQNLMKALKEAYQTEDVTPREENIYHALSLLEPEEVKVVILGQDPYPTKGVANGLAFSVSEGTKLPQSLKNIYKELNYEYGYPVPTKNGNLTPWAKEGVLLLNTSLTTIVGKPNSMKRIGWQTFTSHLLMKLSSLEDHKRVYLLFGNEAIKKESLLNPRNSLLVKAVHPSPLSASRGFFHCDCFKKVNQFLSENQMKPINWQILDDCQLPLF